MSYVQMYLKYMTIHCIMSNPLNITVSPIVNGDATRPVIGFANMGNTCFMNCMLQILMCTHELNTVFDTCTPTATEKPPTAQEVTKPATQEVTKPATQEVIKPAAPVSTPTLCAAWNRLRQQYRTATQAVRPTEFIQTTQHLLKNFNNVRRQHDATELLVCLLDQFHREMSHEVSANIRGVPVTTTDKLASICYAKIKTHFEASYSKIVELFSGVMVNTITTPKEVRRVPEIFTMLSLPLPPSKQTSLEDQIAQYVSAETVPDVDISEAAATGAEAEAEAKGTRPTTPKRANAVRQTSFWSFPQLLVIQIHRGGDGRARNSSALTFPVKGLNLSSHVIGYDAESFVYDLYGVCNHSGTNTGGHYTALMCPSEAQGWISADDSRVSNTSIKEATLSSNTAYCLFYRKRSHK